MLWVTVRFRKREKVTLFLCSKDGLRMAAVGKSGGLSKEGSDDLAPVAKSALAGSTLSSKIKGHSNRTKCEHFPTTSGKA
jgi:hypothetical protein